MSNIKHDTDISEIADTAGREFVLGFIENEDLGFDSTPPIGELFITTKSRVPVSVSVSVPRAAAGVFTPVSVSVVSGAVKNITIPNKLHMKGTEKGNKGLFHVCICDCLITDLFFVFLCLTRECLH